LELLDKINLPADIRKLDQKELAALCGELRQFMIQNVSKTGGHLASNLGVVELTLAIHRVFDTARDRLVFDVGHQSYVHKILTGRMDRFDTLRQFGGLSGFPKPSESKHDAFIAGHASNSISVALGMARARTLSRRDYDVVAVIGDGALTGGLAYEALSDAGESGERLIIILNDNGMSIMPNVGGMARYLSRQRLKPSYAAFKRRYRRLMEKFPGGRYIYKFTHGVKSAFKEALLHCSMFEEMGLQYAGPIDGHDLKRLTEALSWAKGLGEPVLIHVITQKGKGYVFSEKTPDVYHGVSPFDYKKGVLSGNSSCFSTVFGEELVRLAQQDFRICAVTAAMASGTGLVDFATKFPARFFDVGIAEGHAATMAAGMAAQEMIPVFAVYSTFLQRSYDMLLHDVALSDHHVVFGVDRAGLVGNDGETHQGIYDIGFLSTVPNMKIFCPSSYRELREMLRIAVHQTEGPVAVRYPKCAEGRYTDGVGGLSPADSRLPAKLVREGVDLTIITYGITINDALEAADTLNRSGISVDLLKLGAVRPIDFDAIEASLRKTGRLLVVEECAEAGSVGMQTAAYAAERRLELKALRLLNLGSRFIPHGTVGELRALYGIDAPCIAQTAAAMCGRELILEAEDAAGSGDDTAAEAAVSEVPAEAGELTAEACEGCAKDNSESHGVTVAMDSSADPLAGASTAVPDASGEVRV
jgi:1-deoxy-D-xylulose-5-phosphate synthase